MDRAFIITGLVYAILGMCLGIVMAASNDHGQLVTHAHIMLAGFVVSFLYGLCHKLWLNNLCNLLAKVQFGAHQAGMVLMAVGLFLLYGKYVAPETIEPVLILSSLLVLTGMVLMAVMFIRTPARAT
ncbi:TonB-dependent receptor [Shewanella sedimentimangrovi]|uniref:TonB-dependent receptor n=1 Tax=Shewanella sedimentimangrovi TaxID=2814293 RepID=A0ABX7R098_9GAMM|nr:TonB-dependent receptor [Shewanella sedimentimangrovi]QSX36611.1 TonB-dependent receptor [Shewanella sedimentimangrovi]